VTNLVAPITPATSGQTIPISFTVSNTGQRATRGRASGTTAFTCRRSVPGQYRPDAGQFERFGLLAKRAGVHAQRERGSAEGWSGTSLSGVYRFEHPRRCSTGHAGVEFEQNISRRWRGWANTATREQYHAQPLAITLATPPDLQVTSITIPQSVWSAIVRHDVLGHEQGRRSDAGEAEPVGRPILLSARPVPGS